MHQYVVRTSSRYCILRPAMMKAKVHPATAANIQQRHKGSAIPAAKGSILQSYDSTCLSSSITAVGRRQLTSGAALAAAFVGFNPLWGRASASRGPARQANSMSTAAAAAAGDSSGDVTSTGIVVVYVTAPSAEVGDKLASALVEQKFVACVNIIPGITSIYTWKGKVEKDSEVLLIMKTQAQLMEQLTTKVKELHPYDEPEVIAMPVVGGSDTYMTWVRDATRADPG